MIDDRQIEQTVAGIHEKAALYRQALSMLLDEQRSKSGHTKR